MLDQLAQEVEMSKEEIDLFKKILQLTKQKEDGMFESVTSEIDKHISEVVNSDTK